jgi:thiol:disulfide interchange protein DsbC
MRLCRSVALLVATSLSIAAPAIAYAQDAFADRDPDGDLERARVEAEAQLHQSFTNLQFEDFGLSPVKGPIYQASAGGRVIYYAPESEHLLFATVYDKNGVNLTALDQEARMRGQLSAIDLSKALAIGPASAPSVIEFTDPDCPYCRALDRFWASKAIEGKPVRRLVYFVSGIHPQAAAKAEHILCSPDPTAAFKAIYAGTLPAKLATCEKGRAKVEADAILVRRIGVSGTPTLIAGGKAISGFQQGELEAFLDAQRSNATAPDARP